MEKKQNIKEKGKALHKKLGEKSKEVQKQVHHQIKTNKYLIIFVLLLTAYALYSYFTKGLIYSLINFDSEAVKSTLLSYGSFSYLFIILLRVLEVIISPIPPMIIYVISIPLYGPYITILIAVIGNFIGATICFYLARQIGRDYIESKIDNKNIKLFNKYAEKYGLFVLFFLRVNPFTSSDIFSYIAGLTRMKYVHFILGTTFGLLPLIIFQSFFVGVFIQSDLFRIFVLIFTLVYFILFIIALYKIFKFKGTS